MNCVNFSFFSKKLGNTPDAILKGKSKSKTNGTPKKKGEKKKNPWSDSDASDVEGATRALFFLKIN